MAAARGIVFTSDRSMLVGFGGPWPVELNGHWVYPWLHRMNFIQRKVTISKSNYATANFDQLKTECLEDVVAKVSELSLVIHRRWMV